MKVYEEIERDMTMEVNEIQHILIMHVFDDDSPCPIRTKIINLTPKQVEELVEFGVPTCS